MSLGGSLFLGTCSYGTENIKPAGSSIKVEFTTCMIDTVFISLAGNNSRKLPLKPPDSSSRLSRVTSLFISFKTPSRATKEKTRPDLLRYTLDERSEHEKQSSNAIFIPPQCEVQELKLHMDAIEPPGD